MVVVGFGLITATLPRGLTNRHLKFNDSGDTSVPSLEWEVVEDYHTAEKQTSRQAGKERKRLPSGKELDRARAIIRAQKKPLGCILLKDNQIVARYFHGPELQFQCSTISEALSWLIEKGKRLKHKTKILIADSDDLTEEALNRWKEMRDKSRSI